MAIDPVMPPSERVDYSLIVDRPRIAWPGGARVAFWVSPNVEHYLEHHYDATVAHAARLNA